MTIKTDNQLATALWNTRNNDAQLLAILLIKPNGLPRDVMDQMMLSVGFMQFADWLIANAVKGIRTRSLFARHGWITITPGSLVPDGT